MTSSPELIAHINGVRQKYTRTRWWYILGRFTPDRETLLSELETTVHQKRRAQMVGGVGTSRAGKETVLLDC